MKNLLKLKRRLIIVDVIMKDESLLILYCPLQVQTVKVLLMDLSISFLLNMKMLLVGIICIAVFVLKLAVLRFLHLHVKFGILCWEILQILVVKDPDQKP